MPLKLKGKIQTNMGQGSVKLHRGTVVSRPTKAMIWGQMDGNFPSRYPDYSCYTCRLISASCTGLVSGLPEKPSICMLMELGFIAVTHSAQPTVQVCSNLANPTLGGVCVSRPLGRWFEHRGPHSTGCPCLGRCVSAPPHSQERFLVIFCTEPAQPWLGHKF